MNVKVFSSDTTFAGIESDSRKTHIISLDVDAHYDASERCYKHILSSDEISKANRFFQIHDRANFLVRKYYLRLLLSKMLSQSPENLRFDTRGNKKPIILDQEYNTSHSGKYAVIAISAKSVGIDIEKIDHSFYFDDVARRSFTNEEQRYLKENNTTHAFFHLWTRKEAILKASGEGLINNLHLLNCVPSRVLRSGLIYELTTFSPEADYVVSIATEPAASEIQYWRIHP